MNKINYNRAYISLVLIHRLLNVYVVCFIFVMFVRCRVKLNALFHYCTYWIKVFICGWTLAVRSLSILIVLRPSEDSEQFCSEVVRFVASTDDSIMALCAVRSYMDKQNIAAVKCVPCSNCVARCCDTGVKLRLRHLVVRRYYRFVHVGLCLRQYYIQPCVACVVIAAVAVC